MKLKLLDKMVQESLENSDVYKEFTQLKTNIDTLVDTIKKQVTDKVLLAELTTSMDQILSCINAHNKTLASLTSTLKTHEEAIVDLNYAVASLLTGKQSSAASSSSIDLQLPDTKPKNDKPN